MIDWVGGRIDYSQGSFTMNVRSIRVVDSSSGSAYKYGDDTGSWKSIEILRGDAAASSASEGQASAASATTATLEESDLAAGKTTVSTSLSLLHETVSATQTAKSRKVGGIVGITTTLPTTTKEVNSASAATAAFKSASAIAVPSSTLATGDSSRSDVVGAFWLSALFSPALFLVQS